MAAIAVALRRGARSRALAGGTPVRETARTSDPSVDLAALRRLSVSDRLRLVAAPWDSIAEEAPDEALPLTPALAAELDRRLVEHEADPDDVVPWDEVRARLDRR